jgi:ubiquinone/menaquinone biosynthesis C-methylase UbiE
MRYPQRLRHAYLKAYAWAAERLYHQLAWAYEAVAWLVSFGRWDAWRRQALAHAAGDRLLEIGFGTGALLTLAAERYAVVGLDPSREMHRVARRRLARRRLFVPRVRGRAQALPFAAGVFDTVIATFPTAYVLAPETLRAVARVLTPDINGQPGRFVVTGLGVRSDRRAVQRSYGGVLGGSAEDGVARFARWAGEMGFQVTLVDEVEGLIRMPVLILQPADPGPNAKEDVL